MVRNKENVMIVMAMMILVTSLGALNLLDRGHGGFGAEISRGEVLTELLNGRGMMTDPSIPEDLILLGASRTAELSFRVENRDPDNDIDTIFVTVPGTNIISGSHTWPDSTAVHEWDWVRTATDSIRFTARDDLPGRVAGGSSQYDVAGNIDDALDMVNGRGESITLSVLLKAPTTPGIRTGTQGIALEVADLKTEEPGSPRTVVDPYPVPYAVAVNGTRFMLMVLKDAPDCELEVMYGDNHLFAPASRAPSYSTSDRGFRYRTYDGQSVALLEVPPTNVLVKPMVRATRDGLSGTLTLDMSILSFPDVTSGSPTVQWLVEGYEEELPGSASLPLDLDLDSDGILNMVDPDMDGDDIPNDEDPMPRVHDRRPVIMGAVSDLTVREGRPVTLTVRAYDPEDLELNYSWSHSTDAFWKAYGSRVTMTSLPVGIHRVTVTITDPAGNQRSMTINITSNENRSPVITKAASDPEKVKSGEAFTLSGSATDPDGDTITYSWTRQDAPSWKADGRSVTVYDLPQGRYTFVLHATDGELETVKDVMVEVEGEDEGFPWQVILIASVALVAIAILIVVLTRRKDSKESTEGPSQEDVSESEDEKPVERPSEKGPSEGTVPSVEETDDVTPDDEGYDLEEMEEENMEPCPECGGGISPGDLRCPSCGALFEEVHVCSQCGSEVKEGSTSCPGCRESFRN